MQFPYGSIAIKAAWLELKGFPADQRRRFYHALGNRQGSGYRQVLGNHGRSGWAAHCPEDAHQAAVDLVQFRAGGQHSYVPGRRRPVHVQRRNPGPDAVRESRALGTTAAPAGRAFNVVRSTRAPIHDNTARSNQRYRELLEGTIWKYSALVTTQWPLMTGSQAVPVPASQTGEIFFTFAGTGPGSSASSAHDNVRMETFDQFKPELGCIGCHNQARLGADFMWSVLHAWPARLAPALK